MMKRWMRILMTALALVVLVGSTVAEVIQAGQLKDPTTNNLIQVQNDPHQPDLPPGFQIVATTSTGMILDFETPIYRIETSTSENQPCQVLKVDGYGQASRPGEPGLVSAGVMLGIPLDITPSYTIQSMETTDFAEPIHLCPVGTPVIQRSSTGLPQDQGDILVENKEVYSQDGFLPSQPLVLVVSGTIRSQHVARLSFTPFRYNPARDVLQVVSHIRVEVQLGSHDIMSIPTSLVDEGPFESLLQTTLINYNQARFWRVPRQPDVVEQTVPTISIPNDQPEYKIQVDQDGIYQVTYAALQLAGVPVTSLDPRTIKLVNQGVEIPIYFIGEQDGVFDQQDYFLFYGQKIKTKFTNTNVYWLSWGVQTGLRMSTQDGTAHGADTPVSFKTTLHLEEDHLYYNGYPSGPQNDHWYWFRLSANNGPVSQDFTFTIPNLDSESPTATVRGLLKGYYADPHHHTLIYLNGNLIDDHTWPNGGEYAFSIETSYLVDGNNTLTISCPRDGGILSDFELINWFEIDYSHTFTAENDLLDFRISGQWQFQVGSFISNTIAVFDVTNPLAPARITGGSIMPDGSLYQISFEQDLSREHSYLVLSPSRWMTPLSITQDAPSNLKDPANGADYIIISYADFQEAIQPLADYHAKQGMRVKVVDVQDVYDEFNGGVFNPQAIQDFLAYTYSNWVAPAPTYVLLVGDGHFDFKNYYGTSGPNYIPPFLGEFDPYIGEAASDNRFVTVSGDDILPDMYIGRLPANTADETSAMVNKIISYEQNPIQGDWDTRLTFVADDADTGGNFPIDSDLIADNYLSNGYSAEKIYYKLPPYENADDAKIAIINSINQGRLIIHYTGHASTQFWASEKLFSVSSIDSLTNSGAYPFFIPMTCMDGYFIWPTLPSLGESMVRVAGKGAIASWSPSGFGLTSGHHILAQGLYQAFFRDGTTQFGAATTFAKYYLAANGPGYSDLIDTYILFGDPASRLKTQPFFISIPLVLR